MNRTLVFLLISALTLSPLSWADEVVREVEDNTVGGVFGGTAGLLVGGAIAGGIPGALLGGVLGLFGGKQLQESSGLSQRAYVVAAEDGEHKTIRSPQAVYQPGDDVVLVGDRIQAAK